MEPHKHCIVCGISMPPDETICSEKCRDQYDIMLKKRKNRVYLIYVLMALFVAIVVYQQLGG